MVTIPPKENRRVIGGRFIKTLLLAGIAENNYWFTYQSILTLWNEGRTTLSY
jgi:hypothetical protein